MATTTILDLTILDLGHIETALEAYIEDAIDSKRDYDEGTADYSEIEVIIEEASDLLGRVVKAQGR